jgi:predicted ferric reductase
MQAIVLVGVLVTLSARILRRRAYDLFLLIHISLAAAALVVIKLHLAGLPDKGNFFAFVWVCVGFWSLDRVMRLARVAYHSAIPLAQGVKAVATLDPDSGIIRLDASEFFKGKSSPPAGSFYYIYDIARAKGYENHPFTICSWNSPNSTDCQKQSFLIRPQDGYTGYLRDKLSRTGTDKSCRLTILLEGPYDGGILLDGHSDVLMIVGGSGVSAAISQAYSLLNSRQSRLHLIWIVREKAFVDNILDQELKSLVEHPDASLDIYVTGVSASTPVETEKTLAQVADHIHAGRPDTADIIAEARVTAGRSLAVFCSGPAGLREDCRRIVPALMREPGVDIRLYEERFDW